MNRNCASFKATFLSLIVGLFLINTGSGETEDLLSQYNVIWDSLSINSSGSMPIGNGDIGLNVWVEESGNLIFFIGKTDAWNETHRLLKLGRVRISFSPNPFTKGDLFRQTLKLREGEIEIAAGPEKKQVLARIWVDANNPIVHIEMESPKQFDIKVHYENWRTERRQIKGDEIHSAFGLHGDNPNPVYVEPDVIMENQKDRIVWYHHNDYSCFPLALVQGDLSALLSQYHDPLINRTFGGCINGENLVSTDKQTLTSLKSAKRYDVSVFLLTRQTETIDKWLFELNSICAAFTVKNLELYRTKHRKWWFSFWDRSWIYVSGNADAEAVTLGYTLQNWMNACAGRGAYPFKFNGSIFNVDATPYNGQLFDADFRLWGGAYWFQNTRLLYWPMLSAGHFDMIQPFFKMYLDALPMAKDMTRIYYNHEGAFFPETMYFWGTYTIENYGWDRKGKQKGLTDNRYIRYYWQGSIELSKMMLDYYDITCDEKFLTSQILPFISEIITFFDCHYSRDEKGLIKFEPAQSLETYWNSVNPLPEIAGLRSVLERLLQLPVKITTEAQRTVWKHILNELPPLPIREVDGQIILAPADSIGQKENMENPELYAIFPYHLYGVGKNELELARRTFFNRIHKRTGCWFQDSIDAAMLGLAEDAKRDVIKNFTMKNPESHFPAFWGISFDWVPDEDNGGVAMIALQRMILQNVGQKIYLLPAWPKEWNVNFKLHATLKTTVEGEVKNGEIVSLMVLPESRQADVIIVK
jgi:hypothetical protein